MLLTISKSSKRIHKYIKMKENHSDTEIYSF